MLNLEIAVGKFQCNSSYYFCSKPTQPKPLRYRRGVNLQSIHDEKRYSISDEVSY